MKRQANWIVGVSDGKVHEYKIGDVTYFVSAEFDRSSQTNLRDRTKNSGQQSHTFDARSSIRYNGSGICVFGCREGGLMQ